ncbi:MAG: DNA-binding response regulator [Geobacter sp.]|nr:MAG: DNA-binding response regulator [Geobacter sp.]
MIEGTFPTRQTTGIFRALRRDFSMQILIIEKENKTANFIKRGLEAEGYEVEVAYDCAIRFIWTVNPVLTGQQIRN